MTVQWIALALAAAQPEAGPPPAEPALVSTRQEASGSHTLVHELVVPAPIAEVWAAISTRGGWLTWAVPVARMVEGETDVMETSYTPGSRTGDPSTIRQQFLAQLPGRILVFRTVRAPQGFPHFDTYARVISFIELEPVGDRLTHVRLTGTGYADTDAGRQLMGFFREGNRVSLERLRQRFATGPLDWNQVLRRGN